MFHFLVMYSPYCTLDDNVELLLILVLTFVLSNVVFYGDWIKRKAMLKSTKAQRYPQHYGKRN